MRRLPNPYKKGAVRARESIQNEAFPAVRLRDFFARSRQVLCFMAEPVCREARRTLSFPCGKSGKAQAVTEL